jgi:succinoglycan biosynthesis protein ExoO
MPVTTFRKGARARRGSFTHFEILLTTESEAYVASSTLRSGAASDSNRPGGPMDFSVVIPAYNVSGIIARAIRSAAAQTFPPLEILVIDDCSTDNTIEVAKALEQEIPSLRVLSAPINGGPSAARNVGLRAARADWIALLDADDAWKPRRLERLSEVALATSADFVADDLVMWDIIAGVEFEPPYYRLPEPQKQIRLLDIFRAEDGLDRSKPTFGLMKPIMRRKFLADHKLEYDESINFSEDMVLYAESLFNGAKIIMINEAYYIYSVPSTPSGHSPHSRSVLDYSKIQRLGDMLSQKYEDRVDPTLKRAIDARRTAMALILHSNTARIYKRSGQYGKYLAYLAARPVLTGQFVARKAISVIFSRV